MARVDHLTLTVRKRWFFMPGVFASVVLDWLGFRRTCEGLGRLLAKHGVVAEVV